MKTRMSRRAALAGGLALAAPATAALPAAIGDDAELIGFGKRLDVLYDWKYWLDPLVTHNKWWLCRSEKPAEPTAEDIEWHRVVDLINELAPRAMALTARTIEGLAAKARIAACEAPELFEGLEEDGGGFGELSDDGYKFLRSLIKAVLAAAGQTVPYPAFNVEVELEEGQDPTDYEALAEARLLGKDLVRPS